MSFQRQINIEFDCDEPDPIDVSFYSGMSSISDMRGAIDARVPLGVVAGKITLPAKILRIPGYLNAGGQVFVDSGAFSERSTGIEPDWDRILGVYETLAELSDDVSRLFVVAPDKVGDQNETLARLVRHRNRVTDLISAGCRVIIPLQQGGMSAKAMLNEVTQILGTRNFVVGIPSCKDALSLAQCSDLEHSAFHILGRVCMDADQRQRIAALRTGCPGATISADASWLRSRLPLIASATQEERQFRREGKTIHWDHPRAAAVTRSIQNNPW